MNIIPFVVKLLILHNLTEIPKLYYEKYDAVIETQKYDSLTFQIKNTNKILTYNNYHSLLERLSDEKIKLISENNCYLSNQPHLMTSICDNVLTKFELVSDIKTQFPISPYQYNDYYLEYFNKHYRTKYYPVLLGETENDVITISYMSDRNNMYEDLLFVYHGLQWIGWISINEK